ncbi:hypothetical protein PROFUN_07316 [Planoprotostelium fungivorum]|uniref:Clu domain-containing protein n=1 Tax=Planoprotostelium fungivorum TaxID=1890364 RepID=A0A2P6NM88_9EUKA|nr:hypothetical protein PROFUN_07316 [Planoprotostelium fungivorum]
MTHPREVESDGELKLRGSQSSNIYWYSTSTESAPEMYIFTDDARSNHEVDDPENKPWPVNPVDIQPKRLQLRLRIRWVVRRLRERLRWYEEDADHTEPEPESDLNPLEESSSSYSTLDLEDTSTSSSGRRNSSITDPYHLDEAIDGNDYISSSSSNGSSSLRTPSNSNPPTPQVTSDGYSDGYAEDVISPDDDRIIKQEADHQKLRRKTVKDKLISGHYEESKWSDERSKSLSMYRDWNEEYQICCEIYTDVIQRGAFDEFKQMVINGQVMKNMKRVARDFADTATIYAKIIISEFELPLEKKTIKPIDIGGIAGGSKYRVQNILYKFAFDTIIVDEPRLWMYGGDVPDHRAAAKAAKNELKGLEAHFCRYVPGLRYPLMTLVDYKGYRVLAMAILPIDRSTLRYGSDDAGRHVHMEDEELNEKMKLAGERLNLAGHVTGSSSDATKIIYGPGDIEGHRGHDGRLYVVDFGRLLPPEDPKLRLQHNNRSVFAELLRPEAVSASSVPLCSDAFTKWNTDPEKEKREKLNGDVAALSRRIREKFTKAFLIKTSMIEDFWRIHNELPFDREMRYNLDTLMNTLHMKGLNYRHIGVIYGLSDSQHLRRILLSVAAARCAKIEIKEIMRAKMKEIMTPTEEPFKAVIAKFLNQLSGRSKNSLLYWRRDLCRQLRDWFQFSFTQEEISRFDLNTCGDVRLVVNLVVSLCNIKLLHEVDTAITRPGRFCFHFSAVDIKSTEPRTKHRSDIYFIEGMNLMRKIAARMKMDWKTEETQAKLNRQVHRTLLREVNMSILFFQQASAANPGSPLYPTAWGNATLVKASLLHAKISEATYKYVFMLFSRTLMSMEKGLTLYAEYLKINGRTKKREKILEMAEQVKKERASEDNWKMTFNF